MSSFKLSIKNAGKVYEIELQSTSTGAFLKEKIQELTLIPPERQKILIKGGKINDNDVVADLKLNLSQPIMVLGTPDKNLPSKPVDKPVFLEDLNANQLYKVSSDPSGLVNLGNTCYLNSSLQALYSIKILRDRLKSTELASAGGNQASIKFNLALKSLFEQMDKKQESIKPLLPLTLIRQINPEFATTDNSGRPQQHDAEEAYSEMVRLINDGLNLDDFFRVGFKNEQKCITLPSDEKVVTYDDALKLNCHIDIKTNFLRDGILNGLKESLEKFNPTLQSNAEYEINKSITRLPRYLTIHFLRFYWRRDINKKSKILRKVSFPFELDLAEMLDESVRAEKVKVRDEIRKIEKDNLDLIRDFKKQKKDNALTPLEQQEEDELKIASINSKFEDELVKVLPSGYDLQSSSENPSSVYELTAVITHAGASSESGHYQAYVKDDRDLDGDRWWKFNDEKVSAVNREKIEQFAGGGESDSALILIYKGIGL